MGDRRKFLASSAGSLAGLMFCGCGLLHARQAMAQGTAAAPKPPAAPAVRRAPRRVKPIDPHPHCYSQESLDLMGPEGAKAVLPPVKGQAEHFITLDKR